MPALLFLVPFLSALLCATLGWLWRPACRAIAVVAMAATSVLGVVACVRTLTDGPLRTYMSSWPPPLGIELMVDPLAALVAIVVGVVGLLVISGSIAPIRHELRGREVFFYSIALLLLGGLMGMTVTHDLFNLFVHLEVASLSAYALTAAGGRGSARAALRYLLIGSLGASLYLLGVGFLYAATGSLNMSDVAGRLADADPRLVGVASVLAIGGLGVKMGLFPLHIWMPEAYSRAPLGGATLMAPLVTKVSAYALIRVLFWVFDLEVLREQAFLLDMLAWTGAAAIIVGATMALLQNDLLRLLAYSSISQMGIVALGVGLANPASMTGGVMHVANDALMKGALFVAASAIVLRYNVREVDRLWELRGRAPWLSAVIVISGWSLVGLPPMCGFFGKWYVLKGALQDDRWVLAAATVIGSLATAAYVARILERLFFARVPEGEERAGDAGIRLTVVAGVALAAGIVLLGLFSGRVIEAVIEPALPMGL